MKTLNLITKGVMGVSVISLLAAGSAFAGGTAAGTNVQNTFTLNYKVGTITQTPIATTLGGTGTEAPTDFTVDRKVDLTVSSSGDTNVSPGQQNAQLVYSVTNDSNDTVSYALSLLSETTDDFNASGLTVKYIADNGTGGVCDSADITAALAETALGTDLTANVAADAVICVVVEGDIALAESDTNTSMVSLIAKTHFKDAGALITADSGGNTITGAAENYLADGQGSATTGDVATDGGHSATGTYTVESPDLTAVKTVVAFGNDSTNCGDFAASATAGAYMAAGACVEYTITVTNTGATATATDIAVQDILPTNLEFVAAQQTVFTGGTLTVPTTTSTKDCDGTDTTCKVAITAASLASGEIGTLVIRALVD